MQSYSHTNGPTPGHRGRWTQCNNVFISSPLSPPSPPAGMLRQPALPTIPLTASETDGLRSNGCTRMSCGSCLAKAKKTSSFCCCHFFFLHDRPVYPFRMLMRWSFFFLVAAFVAASAGGPDYRLWTEKFRRSNKGDFRAESFSMLLLLLTSWNGIFCYFRWAKFS